MNAGFIDAATLLNQRLLSALEERKGSDDIDPRSLKTSLFSQVLSSALSAGTAGSIAPSTGLRITDYLANPVQALSSMIEEADADDAPLTTAMNNSAAATDKLVACLQALQHPQPSDMQSSLSEMKRNAAPADPEDLSLLQKIDQSITRAAEAYNLPAKLIRNVIKAESGFQVAAVSPAGAQGLMQLMPGTARELGVTNPFDIEQNIDGGARYLRRMLDMFKGDVRMALAAYNAGPGVVMEHQGVPPYQETQHYINKVMNS